MKRDQKVKNFSFPLSSFNQTQATHQMRNCLQLLPYPLLGLLLFSILCLVQTKSFIEPCSSSDSCPSLLFYLLPWDSKLSEIASRFHVNVSDILAANSVFPIVSSQGNQILRAKSLVKIPISCSCAEGIRRYLVNNYIVQPADTLESISQGYGGLVSADQIMSVNSISATNPLTNGGSLVIPLPCTCLNNVNNGQTTVYMSYVVQAGESFNQIASVFGTTINELQNINGLTQAMVDTGDILAVPFAACSSASLKWYNESMIVPNGSYALTATNCIKCYCGPMDLMLHCVPSGLDVPCYNLQCQGSNLVIGDEYVAHSKAGCNVTKCVYRGHRGGKIFRSMMNSSYLQCPDNRNQSTGSCWPLSWSAHPIIPHGALAPGPSPMPVSKADLSGMLGQATFINLLLLLLPQLVPNIFI